MRNERNENSSHAARTGERATRFRYVIIGMLFVMAVVNYVDRGALSYTSEHLIKQYGFSKAEWGAVLGYFGYGYMFGAVLGGTLSDRLGPRKVWIYAGLVWSLFEIATAYAGDIGIALLGGSALTGFATIRVLFGFAEGPAFSTINKSVSNWSAPRERALMSSLTLASTPVGANQRLIYAQNQAPYGAGCTGPGVQSNGALYAGGARGNLRDSDATVSRYGYPLYNWGVIYDVPVP